MPTVDHVTELTRVFTHAPRGEPRAIRAHGDRSAGGQGDPHGVVVAGGERPGLRDAPGGLTQTLALACHAMESEEGRNQDDAALGHETGARLVDQVPCSIVSAPASTASLM